MQTAYVPHLAGTVLGSHHRQPWLADPAAAAAAAPWHGQPVFAERTEAFAWITLARAGTFARLDFAVARVDADSWLDPHGRRRVRIDHPALVEPHHQVVRADADSPGPDPSVLRALHAGVHEQILPGWRTSRRYGAGPDSAAALAVAVWHRAYPIAFGDAATVLGHRIGHAARLLASDPDPRWDLDDATRAGLEHLWQTAAGLDVAETATPPPWTSLVAATVAADHDSAARAVNLVWTQALITAAADGLNTAATALTNAWNTATAQATATPAGQAVGAWLHRTLAEGHQTVLAEWHHATARHAADRQPERPAPAAARAYPTLTAIGSSSTVDGTVALPPTAAVAALSSGRSR